MARVSLIPLIPLGSPWPTDRLASFRAELERAGDEVSIELGESDPAVTEPPLGLVALAIERVRSAPGIYLVVVDLAMDYSALDVLAVVQRLEVGESSLVIAARRGRWFGSVARRITGTSDPASGLVGLTRGAARLADRSFAPVGSRFVCELLARLEGEKSEVEVAAIGRPARRWSLMDDIRHAKRIADDRFGNVSRLLQFCFVGASGMVVDLSTYAALQAILARTPLANRLLFGVDRGGGSISLAVAVAAVLSIVTAMTWNFSLNRRLTFNDARRGSIAHQFLRYVLSNLVGSGISLSFRLLLPGSVGFFARHRLAAAFMGIVVATGISFSMARWFVFDARGSQNQESNDPGLATRCDFDHDQQPSSMHRSVNRMEYVDGPSEIGTVMQMSQE